MEGRITLADAQQTIDHLFNQTEEHCLQMFAASIREADKYGSDKWGITLYENDRVRLNVGSLVVCTLHAGGIWFALDKSYVGTEDEKRLNNTYDWNWTREDDYVAVPAMGGYYRPSTPRKHKATWPIIKKMHFALIEKAAKKYKRLQKRSRVSHSTEFLIWLRKRLNQTDLPEPDYSYENSRTSS